MKEIRDGEREPTFEVRNENHPLTGLRGGGLFIARSTVDNLGADKARFPQPLDVLSANF